MLFRSGEKVDKEDQSEGVEAVCQVDRGTWPFILPLIWTVNDFYTWPFILPLIWTVNDFYPTMSDKVFYTLCDHY